MCPSIYTYHSSSCLDPPPGGFRQPPVRLLPGEPDLGLHPANHNKDLKFSLPSTARHWHKSTLTFLWAPTLSPPEQNMRICDFRAKKHADYGWIKIKHTKRVVRPAVPGIFATRMLRCNKMKERCAVYKTSLVYVTIAGCSTLGEHGRLQMRCSQTMFFAHGVDVGPMAPIAPSPRSKHKLAWVGEEERGGGCG